MPSPVYVNDDWTGLPDGTVVGQGQVIGTNAFATIEAGYDAVDSPGTVIVYPGLYEPAARIDITKDGVTFLGPQANVDPRPGFLSSRTAGSADEAIVNGRGVLVTIFRIQANDITINGFEVRNGTGDLIDSLAAAPIKFRPVISYNIIHQATGDEGIRLRNIQNGVIEYNYVFDTVGDAINLCCESLDSVIQYNEVRAIRSPDAAIYVYNATNITVQWNLVQDVQVNDGIKLGSSSAPFDTNRFVGRVLNNVVRDLEQDGITVISRDAVVDGNDVYRSRSSNGAVYVDRDLDNIQITNNCIHDNGVLDDGRTTYGIRIGSGTRISTNVHVNNNNIFNNVDGGLIFNPSGVPQPPDPLDAKNNWWGSPSGPNTMPGPNSVIGNVDYIPFLTEPGPNCLSLPVINGPGDIIVDNDPGQCSALVSYTIAATSPFFPINKLTCTPGDTHTYTSPYPYDISVEEEMIFPVGTTPVSCTVTNIDGSTDTVEFNVTVRDTESPTITCPEDRVVFIETGEMGTIVNFPDPIVTDNCSISDVSCTPEAGTFFPVGTTEVTCRAEDSAGNVSTCNFNINVEQAPPSDLFLNLFLSYDVQVVTNVTVDIEGQLPPPRNSNTIRSAPQYNKRECINVEKVYDWMVFCKEVNRTFPIPPDCNLAILECENNGGEITIICDPAQDTSSFTVLDPIGRFPNIPGVQIVPIRFHLPIGIQFLCNGELFCKFEVTVCHVENLALFYPVDTEIQASVTDARCYVSRQ